MALLSDSWLLDCFTLLTTSIVILLSWLKWSQGYWHRKGVVTLPTNILFGNAKGMLTQTESVGDFILRLYAHVRSHNKPYGGTYAFFMPGFMPVDPELIKNILQNDFDHFVDRGLYLNEKDDPLSAHLFSLEGSKWRNLRIKLTPTFTSGKMKMMFDILVKCGEELTTQMDKSVGKESVDIKNILSRFGSDIIGNCAFGIDCNSLKNPDDEFTSNFKLFSQNTFMETVKMFLSFLTPNLMKKFGAKAIKPRLSKFFMKVVKDTVDYREKNNVYRKDFMHLLLQLKNRGKLVDDGSIHGDAEEDKEKEVTLTMNELAAQAFVFFLAGLETSSTTLTFCLFELASNPEIQEKLRQEVNEVLKKHDNNLTYDAIMEMHYMEKVINEALRKYPPTLSLQRVCTKEYIVPGTDLVIEKGTAVSIPILGLHRDEEHYPDPDKFDPERFSEENKKKRHPFTFLPFGEGPRVCIGLRFGMMEMKVGLSILLQNYKFSVGSKTILPLQMDPTNFFLAAKGGVWLDVAKV